METKKNEVKQKNEKPVPKEGVPRNQHKTKKSNDPVQSSEIVSAPGASGKMG
ncbi:MAG: hypothetical protein SGI71_13600 [Verrucomicrobiota bacterium]|nr:hypothetical protein [Verrucomicrobiota bacterium]